MSKLPIHFTSIFILYCIFVQSLAYGQNYKIAILAEPNHFALSSLIEERLYKIPNHTLRIMRFEPKSEQTQKHLKYFKQKFDLVLAIGPASLYYFYEAKPFDYPIPIVSILTRAYELEKNLHSHSQNSALFQNLVQLYLDQPLYRQVNLVRALCQHSKCVGSIGVALGPTSIKYRKELETLAENYHLPFNIVEINPNLHPVEDLQYLVKESKMLLNIPDESIFNSRTGRGLLLSSYHNKTPIIGYSKNYVNHGALAAVYTSGNQIAEETTQLILQVLTTPLPFSKKSYYSKDFSVEMNPQVAKSMGFTLQTESELKKQMLLFEEKERPNG